MASQVAHIVYAGKYLDRVKSEDISVNMAGKNSFVEYEKLFLLGACFPDIRRIDYRIKRSDTHIILNDLNADLHYLEPFQAGWKLHLYCDMRREEILNSYDFYKLPKTLEMSDLPNKLLEDEIVYDSYDNWKWVMKIFNKLPKVDVPNFVPRGTFEIWYAILAKYFEKKPDSHTMRVFLGKQPKLADKADDIVAIVDKLRKNDRVVELLGKVEEEIIIRV